ncbi:LuxR C-terminal-related transcriptional regulator [Sphingorhabdus sp. SMR4y]|uniref:LuxR C-terminal-related transcriptional regulator n=1 Tax=Sphingorhabdus sp. SMR4y TaxID=2584094 RepID=UPI000B5EEF94|nr:response regulator transcription factor [Sphingorhabdus sp. SMR4y]ASK89297.1 DNA-binding response regulator [Sphingorhabdus sp. SMR4y]
MSFGRTYTAVIADDHAIIRSALSHALVDHDALAGYQIEPVATVDNGIDAIAAIRKYRPDLLMLDISMPHAGGTEVLLEARRWSSATKVVIFTGVEASGKIAELVDIGADGVFCKSDDLGEVTDALPVILEGGRMICRRFTMLLKNSATFEPLTDRERQVLNLVVSGRTNKEIAGILGISIKTVDRHRTSVMGKTGSHSAAELIAYALREGLIDPAQAR